MVTSFMPLVSRLATTGAEAMRIDAGNAAALGARHRQALQMGVGDGDGLDGDILGAAFAHRLLGGADQRRAERLHVIAEVAVTFGKQQHGAVGGKALAHFGRWCGSASCRR